MNSLRRDSFGEAYLYTFCLRFVGFLKQNYENIAVMLDELF